MDKYSNIYYFTTISNPSKIVKKLGAYTDYDMASDALDLYNRYVNGCYDYNVIIESKEIAGYVGRHVLYMDLYRGYDYTVDNRMIDLRNHIGVYANLKSLQNTGIYKEYYDIISKGNPDDYIVMKNGSIGCKDDLFDGLYLFGDCFDQKWSICIEKIRVYHGDKDHLKDFVSKLFTKSFY